MESLNDLIWNDEDGIEPQTTPDGNPMRDICISIIEEMCEDGGDAAVPCRVLFLPCMTPGRMCGWE